MRFRPGRRLLISAVVLATAPFTLLAVGGPASAAAPRHPIANSKPRWLARAKRDGAMTKKQDLHFSVLLNMRNEAGAQAELRHLSDPASAGYGKALTRAQFLARYAPASADRQAVRSWLRGQGFTVGKTLGGAYIEARGSVASVQKTFGTTLATYTYKGTRVRANTTQLSLAAGTPSAGVGAVQAVLGLDQGSARKQPAALPGPPDGARYGVQPCSAYYGQKIATDKPSYAGQKWPYTVCGYGPQQYQSAYGETGLLNRGVTGKGVTVAITDGYAAPTIRKDADKYSRVHDQPEFRPGQFRQILPDSFNVYDPEDAQGWYGEETLDVEAVHAMAPGANIVYVGGSDDLTGLDDAWAQTIDDHVADIITNSWGDGVEDPGAATIEMYAYFSLEAALTGQSVLFSTGDSGDGTSGGTDPASRYVDFPVGLPTLTAVGGTSVFIGKSGDRIDEHAWQTSYLSLSDDGTAWVNETWNGGGGGGTSKLFPEPYYQKGVVPDSLADVNGTPGRVEPDISMAGDPNTGFQVGETQAFPDGTYWDQYRIGGTSLSSPLMAGVLAVAAQQAGHPLGFVNPLLYKLDGSKALFDVVAPKKPTYQVRTDYANFVDASEGYRFRLEHVDVQSSTLHDTAGYDNATGLGSPNGPAFFTALARK